MSGPDNQPGAPGDDVLQVLTAVLGRQAKALESAGEAMAKEMRSLKNQVTFLLVIAMSLNTAVVVGSLSLDLPNGKLRVDGVDAANAVVDQVESGTLPEQIVYPPPAPMPPPLPSVFDELLPGPSDPDPEPMPPVRPAPLPALRQPREPTPVP